MKTIDDLSDLNLCPTKEQEDAWDRQMEDESILREEKWGRKSNEWY